MLAVVAFVLARSSRGLLLGEAANPKVLAAIKQAIESHPNVERVVELLTMHLAPKQILINAHVKLRPDLRTDDIVKSIEEVEERIKRAEPKVEMIFLEVARDDQADEHRAGRGTHRLKFCSHGFSRMNTDSRRIAGYSFEQRDVTATAIHRVFKTDD